LIKSGAFPPLGVQYRPESGSIGVRAEAARDSNGSLIAPPAGVSDMAFRTSSAPQQIFVIGCAAAIRFYSFTPSVEHATQPPRFAGECA